MSNITERTFDFVVVGGGTAGIALAARLSENPNFTVAVIEAGEYVTDMQSILVPGMAKMAHGNARVDWNFYTVPQPGLKNRKIFQPRGKLIGGSSALNYMAWGRASKEEYDALAAMGNPGWSWDEFLPYMKKVEGHIEPLPETATKYKTEGTLDLYHGKTGPIKKSFHPTFNELHVPFLESLVECGLPWNPDTGSGMNSGTYTGALNIDPITATRSYAATGYYEPVKDAKNLFVFTETQATRVLFETAADGTLIATGVEVDQKGNKFTLNARKEVTLSAGSYKTPPLLELSGIGKADILKKNGIQQLLELPVGENLRKGMLIDHPWVPMCFEVSQDYETLDLLADPERLGKEIQKYQESKSGMFSNTFSAFGFVPLTTSMEPSKFDSWIKGFETDKEYSTLPKRKQYLQKWFKQSDHAHIEYLQLPTFFSIDPDFKSVPGKRYHTIMTGLLHPLSRGSVHISSSDPFSEPIINPAYLEHPLDADQLLSGVRFLQKVASTGPFGKAVIGPYDPPASADTDEAVKDWIRGKAEPFYHPVGTAAMLPKEDGGVVDSQLKVYGTKNLRIADASVIPVLFSAHIQATVYAIAEKAADLILNDNKQ